MGTVHVAGLVSGLSATVATLVTAQGAAQPRMQTDPEVIAAATAAAEVGGTGPYKSLMEVQASLPTHTIYGPGDLPSVSRRPIIVWGNDACPNVGNRF